MGKQFEVESIVSKKIKKGKPYYLVKWKGYPSDDNTWEPLNNLNNCEQILQNFEQSKRLQKKLKSKIKYKTASPKNKQIISIDSSDSESETESDATGRIECDVVNKVINAKLDKNERVEYEVKWNERYDGTYPKNSLVPSKILRERYGLLILEYIESKMKSRHNRIK
jgi:hypothetical protein